MTKIYVCVGRVRGSCGHQHRAASGALRCLAADQGRCSRQGGYSDRAIRDNDGEWYDVIDGVLFSLAEQEAEIDAELARLRAERPVSD